MEGTARGRAGEVGRGRAVRGRARGASERSGRARRWARERAGRRAGQAGGAARVEWQWRRGAPRTQHGATGCPI
eukprot:2392856-Prymnesium_polylepis.1